MADCLRHQILQPLSGLALAQPDQRAIAQLADTLAGHSHHPADFLERPALATLPPRDAKVLRLYFGIEDGQSRTLEEIGRMMGVTRERIRQLRDRALIRLREGETGERLKDLVA